MRQFLLGLFLVLGSWQALTQTNETRLNTQLAYEYYNQQEFEKAAPLFLKLYEENRVTTYLYNYVNCLLQLRDYETAAGTVRKAIRQTKDQNLFIELGNIYDVAGDSKKAEEAYSEPLKNFPQSAAAIINLGNTYSSFGKYSYTVTVFELGRKVLGNPNEFRLELGNTYYAMRRFPEMLEEYYQLILADPKYLSTVQIMIQNAMNIDIDQTLLQLTREKTYSFIQQWPGLSSFYEMLVWVLTQEKRFDEAVAEAIAMDRREQASPDKILQIARISADAGSLDAAIHAYQHLIDRGFENPVRKPVYNLARIEKLLVLADQLQRSQGIPVSSWEGLASDFQQLIADLGKENSTDPAYRKLAHIQAFQMNRTDLALATIENALALPGKQPLFRTECLLEKADILLSSGDPWEASLVYSMVDMENPDNPEGATARFRKAQLSWFTGNYKWALAQLDIIKGSTSKPYANDAMELSILIRENISETDSTQEVIRKLSEADYLIFRHNHNEAIRLLDSIMMHAPDNPVIDDCLYKKAEILIEKNELQEAVQILNQISKEYRYDYWGHKAVYELAGLYQDQLNEPDKAMTLLEEFIRDFPTSFYFLDARDRLKALKGKQKR